MSVAYSTRIPQIVMGAEPIAQQVIYKGAFDILARSRSRVPVRTGNLKNSSGVELGPLSATIFYGANYAYFVEGGTRKMAPQPYLRPAFDYVAPTIEKALRAVVAL